MTVAISYSGGKDSTALLLYAIETLGKDGFIAVYQDTGYEHSSHYDYISYIESSLGIEIIKVKSEKYSGMFDMIEKMKMIPNAHARFCTRELKQQPFKDWLRKNKEVSAVWMGIRAEESNARKERYGGLIDGESFSLSMYPVYGKKEFGHINVFMPIVSWTESEVWVIHKKYNIKKNPQYDFGAARVGCFPCVLGSNRSWKVAWDTEEGKANIMRLAELEDDVLKSRGLSKAGRQRTFRRDQTVHEFIRVMDIKDSQSEMFDDKEELNCSWCKG